MVEEKKITLRPIRDADEEFVFSVYASTRADEMAMLPWTIEQKTAFVRMQFTAQKNHYAATEPGANHDIIYWEETPVGRLYLARREDAFHILDITVLPQYRNSQIGSFILHQLMQEAGSLGRPLTIYVESFNPSLRLFERLGFQKTKENGMHFLLAYPPAKSSQG